MYGIRTIAGLGSYEGWIYSKEMEYCKELGYKFEVLKGYKYQGSTTLFKGYVDRMYKLRLEYPKDHPLNLIAKLLMNSLYGKFGMKTTKTVVDIFDTSKRDDQNRLKELHHDLGEDLLSYDIVGTKFIVVNRNDVSNFHYSEERNEFFGLDVNVGIASAITASARLYMGNFKNSDHILYYTDTDSIVTNKPLESKWVGNKLGQLKLEHEVLLGIFIAPKVYLIADINKNVTVKVKGLSKDAIKSASLKNFSNLLEESGKLHFSQEKWNKNLIDGKISVAHIAYELKVTSNKRRNIYENNLFMDTKPYFYHEIEVTDKDK